MRNRFVVKLIHSLFLFGLGALWLLPSVLCAAETNSSAQQALEQLRMLQKRLSPTQATNNGGGDSLYQEDEKTATNTLQQTLGQVSDTAAQASHVKQQQKEEKRAADATEMMAADEKEAFEEAAFDGVTEQMFPLSPEQIVRIKQKYHSSQYAQESPVGTPPKPTATSQFVNLSPGSTPPVIRLSQGFVSSLVFLDSTGAPWPISAYDLGDPAAFNIQWDKTSNTLMIQASKLYTYGNLAVRLRGLNTPVMLTLIPGQKAVDYRVDLRVQGLGPNAKSMPLEEGIPPAANDLLLSVLDGVPPPGSSRLTISGGDARAWLFNDRMYVRTNLTILSPGWIGSMTSADGMHAYEMQKSPVLLVSWHGKVMQLKVEGL